MSVNFKQAILDELQALPGGSQRALLALVDKTMKEDQETRSWADILPI